MAARTTDISRTTSRIEKEETGNISSGTSSLYISALYRISQILHIILTSLGT